MKTIAKLGPSVRLIVFQFLMKSAQVPAIIPPKRVSDAPPPPHASGVEVLESTPKLNIFPLAINIAVGENYKLVDVWKKGSEKNWAMSFVRFVYCHKEHVKQDELHPDFRIKRSEFTEIFCALSDNNLWATMGHLNPYFEDDGSTGSDEVLMFGCAGRTPDTEVFSGGRDEKNRGIGQKVQLSTISSSLDLIGNNVVLVEPMLLTPVPETVYAPMA